MLPQIQVMPLNSLRISLADYVQLSLQAGFIGVVSENGK
nr:putative sugar ABC transport system, periplasmic binding protein YphF precursor [Escherichia coli]